ncbi:MAG TPA: polysaccharide export protein EpsE [Aquabacterium sp.]|uniref:polysaccharide export protein EpsE n=1 Tax=Aquabacterium sp. TaxID=1872578 RepID=UPI002E3275FF|nr:polysaccharide export protein EpsE [Aquabacterium sp.]HEX5355402.1 polysaccharide export protein EpsE [Aquabacterium sp.]
MKWMRDMARWLLATMLLVFGLGAHAAAGQNDYVLGAGDQIRIFVYQNQDLQLDARINESGTISYPLLGVVKLGGLTVSDAEKKLAAGLRDGNFLKQPQVSILVMDMKANLVSVLGQVNRPGRFALGAGAGGNKLSEILAQAGGILVNAGSDLVVVTGTRDGKPFRKEIDFPRVFMAGSGVEDIALANGDSVWVDRAPQIYIYGEVQRAGTMLLQRDMTVLQALASGGGLTLRGTQRGIRVHRRDAAGQVQVIQPDMNDKLQANDVIYVKESLF